MATASAFNGRRSGRAARPKRPQRAKQKRAARFFPRLLGNCADPSIEVEVTLRVCIGLLCLLGMGAAENASKQDPRPPTRLHINAGTLYTSQGVPIVLRGVDALIAPGGQPGRGKDMDGKLVQIRSGRVFLSYDSLTRLLNHKLKNGKVKDLKVSSDKGQVKIDGKVHKGLDIPFEVKGPVRVTADGHLALHA